MAKIRPQNFVDYNRVIKVIENSINSAAEWGEKTNDAFNNTEERIERLHELMDCIIELTWRYGENNVMFKFTMKKNIPDTEHAPVESTFWKDRIWVDENPENPLLTKIYINF